MKRSDKRGSHVGIVISFVIFVTFLVFLYSIVKPALSSKENKESVLESLELEIIKKTSSDLTTASINVASGDPSCVELNNLIIDLEIGNNIVVKDDLEQTLTAYVHSNSLQINRGTSDRFFKVYYSPEFEELETGSGCSNINYNIGLTKTEEYLFEKKILELITEYEDYENLKTELKVPSGVDFGFGLILENATQFERSAPEVSTNIYIKRTPVQYVGMDGEISAGYLETKIW